jgi:hypothetical protein
MRAVKNQKPFRILRKGFSILQYAQLGSVSWKNKRYRRNNYFTVMRPVP